MKIAITTVAAALFVSIVRATAAAETEATAPVAPRFLSDTGLYSNVAKLTIDPRNRTFSPQYPLWSDGATKRRWVRLPEGSQINVADLEKWDLPVGTKFWKEFSFNGRKVETRFLWQTRKGHWVFASYAWNEAADQRRARIGVRHRQHRGHRRRQASQHPVGLGVPCRATTRAAPKCSASTRCSCRPIAIRTRCTPSRSRQRC